MFRDSPLHGCESLSRRRTVVRGFGARPQHRQLGAPAQCFCAKANSRWRRSAHIATTPGSLARPIFLAPISPEHSMARILTNPIGNFSLAALAFLLCAPPLMAQEALRVPGQSRSPQLMLYVSKALGSGGSIPLVYGLRLEEARSAAPLTQGSLPAGPIRTQLLNLQMEAHADMQVEFGSRVSWDIARGTIGPTSTTSAFVIRLPITRPLLPTVIRPRPSNMIAARSGSTSAASSRYSREYD